MGRNGPNNQGMYARAIEWRKAMDNIGSFELENNGGFVARLDAQFRTNRNEGFAPVILTGTFPLGETKTGNPGEHGVPNGAEVRLVAHVVAGTDRTATQIFTYRRGNTKVARYSVSGTTTDATLAFVGRS
jgi:hypothetical protein